MSISSGITSISFSCLSLSSCQSRQTCASTIRFSLAHALRTWMGASFSDILLARRMVLPSMQTVLCSTSSAMEAVHFMKHLAKVSLSMAWKNLLMVSWEGMPLLKSSRPAKNSRRALAKSSISSQPLTPQMTAVRVQPHITAKLFRGGRILRFGAISTHAANILRTRHSPRVAVLRT